MRPLAFACFAILSTVGLIQGQQPPDPESLPITLAASAAAVNTGEPVTLTVGLRAQALASPVSRLVPARRVTFFDRATILGSAAVGDDGSATFSIKLPPGLHSLSAVTTGSGLRSKPVDFEVKSASAGRFGAPRVFPAGLTPRAMASADFNRDGKADVAVAGAGSISILLGNGDGTLSAPLATAGAIDPAALAAGDFNSDGIMDLAVADAATGRIQILLGAGDGSFGAPHTANIATAPSALAVADFNGDGVADLAIADRAGNIVRVLLGRGDGSFAPPLDLVAGLGPSALAIGDFDGDGKADIAVANSGSDTLTILAGAGDGTFGPAIALPGGDGLAAIAAGDLNGDGLDDIAAFGSRDATIRVYYGAGDGKFQRRTTLPAAAGPLALALGDAPRNGSRALLAADGATVQSREIIEGGRTASANYPGGTQPPSISLADFNDDGRLDIALESNDGIVILPLAAATHFLVSAPALVAAGTSFTVTVTAQDGANATDTSYGGSVTILTTDTAAVLPPVHTLTNGVGTFAVTMKTSGPWQIQATDFSISGFANIQVDPGPTTHFDLVALPSATATAGVAFSITVKARDLYNNLATNYTGTVQFASTDISGVMPPPQTLTNGSSSVTGLPVTLKKAQVTTVRVSDFLDPTIFTDINITVNPGPTTHFTVTAPATATGGTAFSFTVSAFDVFNNAGTNYAGTVHFTSTDGFAVLPVNSTLTAGVGAFSATLNAGGVQTITATDISTAATGTSNGITVTATVGPATHFLVSAPVSVTAGTQFDVSVTAKDALNNTVTGYAGTVQISTNDIAQVLPPAATLTNGVGTFHLTLKTAGNRTIMATDTVNGSITGQTSTLVNGGTATHYTISAPASATANSAFSFTITALDTFNNTANLYAGIVHFTSTDVQAVLPANSTLTAGVGTFSATLKTAGNQTISAVDAGNGTITGTSNTIVVSAASGATHFSVSAPASATAGTAFSITVTALDALNSTFTGYAGTVHFTSSDGQAVLPSNATLTNGVGTFSVTLKTAGNQTVTATDTVTASITGTSNNILVSATAATHFAVSAPASVTANVAFNFTVTALDQFNNTATGYAGTVHFTSTDGLAVLPANSALTNGVGTFSATLKTVGNQTITATDTVNGAITGTSNVIAVGAAPATHFSVSAPASATAGSAFAFTVTALDALNNTVTGYTGTVHFTSTDGQAVLPSNSTLTNGVGTFSATLKTAGNQTITATDTLNGSITGTSNTIAVSAAASTHFAVSAPASATAGTAFNFTVTALDQFNNTATGYAGTVHFTGSDAQAILPANSTLTNGVGTFSATLRTAGSQTITATDTVSPAIAGTSNAIAVSASAATHFTVSAPASASVGVVFNFTVTALDQFNNTATGYAGTVHFTTTAASATLPANSTLIAGTRGFSATLITLGNQTIAATDTGNGAITGTSNTINVVVGPANHFQVSAPASATAGTAFSITVTALDAGNNTVTAYAGTVHFTSTDAQATLPANTTLTNGVGTFGSTLRTAGNQTIAATDTVTPATTGTSNTIAVAALTVTHHFGVQAPASATFGAAFSFTVTAQDQFNNTVTGYSGTVHFTTSDPLGAVPFNSTLVNGAGSFTATLKALGSQTITATDTVTASITGTATVLVNAASVSRSNPQVTPTNIFLQYFQGTDPLLVGSSFTVSTDDGSGFSIAPPPPSWLLLSTLTGIVTPTTVNVKINPTGLAVGTYTATEIATFADGTRIAVNITLQVVGLPRISTDLTGASLVFTAVAGSTVVQSQDVKIFSSIRGITAQSAAAGGTWLSANPSSGSTPFTLHVLANPTGLAVGSYPGTITFTSTSADNSPFTIPVTFNIIPANVISIGAFVNAASMLPNSAAPNTIMTVFGTFPNCTTGGQVTVNGGSVLVFYISPAQINFLLPDTLGGLRTASIQVSCAGLSSQPVSLTLTDYAPAIFTVGQNGQGQAAIINQDHTIETPSPKGSIMEVYATGFGVLVKGADGLARPTLPVTAFVGDVPATVTYAGEAPTWPGLQQINVQIPAGAPSGSAVSVRLVINGISTQTGVTIVVP